MRLRDEFKPSRGQSGQPCDTAMEGVVAPVLSQRMRSSAVRQSSRAQQACRHQTLLSERVREIAPWVTPTQMQAVQPPTQLVYLAAVRDLLRRLGLASVPE